MPTPRISIVIPVYQEHDALGGVIAGLVEAMAAVDQPWEAIVVDDGSPPSDGTWAVISALGREHPQVRGLRLSRNFGKEAAIAAGLEVARGAAICVMDGDGQHPPKLIPELVARWAEGDVDVVQAVKRRRGDEPLLRRVGARWFTRLLRSLGGQDLENATDFKLLDRRVLDAWRRMGERNLFFRGMVSWLGFRVAEVGFEVPDRQAGTSRFTLWRLARLAVTAVTAFTSAPLQLVTLAGLGFLGFASVLGAQTLYRKLAGTSVSGFTTVIILQLLIGSLLMLSLGVLGTYLARIYDEVKARPRYLVSDRTGPAEPPDGEAPSP